MQACKKCGTAVIPVSDGTRYLPGCFAAMGRVLLWIFLLSVLFFALWPSVSDSHTVPPTAAIKARGRDVYVAIVGANTEREPIGLPPLWPKTCKPNTNHPGDVSSKVYTTSSDYFYELYDGPNVGTERHDPYVKGFDYSKLAGAGVPAKQGWGKLQAQNNMWGIAANFTESDDDRIPVLLTHNVDVKEIERVVNQGLKESEFNKDITFSQKYRSTFWNKYFVVIRKDGSSKISGGRFKTKTLGELFDNKELPPRDPSKPPIVYLMP
jgi:hypothetical protein